MEKRLFIGIKIPIGEGLKNEILKMKNALRNDYIKWVDFANMHLTLLFLGNTDAEKIGEITEALKRVSEATPPFKISLVDFGAFKSVDNPSVIWIGIKPMEQIKQLKAKVDENVSVVLPHIVPEERFHPHLTLGRPKQVKNKTIIMNLKDIYSRFVFQESQISAFQLFESNLTPKGPVYTVIHDFAL